jgi:tetratricopeptide (TPR) repeat protein
MNSIKKNKINIKYNSNTRGPSNTDLSSLIKLIQNNRLNELEALAISLNEQYPNDLFIIKILEEIFRASGRFNELLIINKRLTNITPYDSEAHYNLGVTLHQTGKLLDAEKCYINAVKLNPYFVQSFYNLGIIYEKLGKIENAEKNYKKVVEIKSNAELIDSE